MRTMRAFLAVMAVAPLMGQAWDLRIETPFARAQNLPATTAWGLGPWTNGDMDQGRGVVLTMSHRIVRVNPVLRFDWTVEYTQLEASGRGQIGFLPYDNRVKQSGLGAGLDAQFWIPFTGVGGELGLIHRFQEYRFQAAGSEQSQHISRTWLRAGLRWKIPMDLATPYVTASYQWPLSRSRPTGMAWTPAPAAYLAAQGSGEEFDRMWTVGIGVQF